MRLTIRVKHLVALLLTAAAIVALYAGVVEPKLRLMGAEADFKQGSPGGKETMRKAMDEASSETVKWRLIRDYMIESGVDSTLHRHDIVIGPGTTYSSNGAVYPDAPVWSDAEKLPYLSDYAERAPVNGYMVRAAKQAAVILVGRGDMTGALAALEAAEDRLGADYDNARKELKLMRARLLANAGERERSLTLLNELAAELQPHERDLSGQIVTLKALMLIGGSNASDAFDQVNREWEAYARDLEEQRRQYPQLEPVQPLMLEQLAALRDRLREAADKGEPAVVSGVVKRSDGSPLPGVGVYLRHRNDVFRSLTEGEPYQTVTDAEGRYRFEGVLADSYALYIGVTFAQIDGWTWPVGNYDRLDIRTGDRIVQDVTLRPLMDIYSPVDNKLVSGDSIRFRWQPVEGAASYRITLYMALDNGSIGMMLKDRIQGTELEMPIEELYDHATGIAYNDAADGKREPHPVSLLGFANPDNRYHWSVEALDADGRPITRSNGYRLNESTVGPLPFFYLKNRTLTPADRLLLDGKTEEAFAAYKAALQANPDDTHSLRMIIRTYETQASAENRQLSDEAMTYVRAMLDLRPSVRYAWIVFDYRYRRGEWDEVNRMYDLLSKLEDGENGYTSSLYAVALMRQNRLEEASSLFARVMELDDSHRFVGHYAALSLYLDGRMDEAAELARRYPERELNPYGPVWAELIEAMAAEREADASADDYDRELRVLLERSFAGDNEAIRQWADATERNAMKAFVTALLVID